MEGQTPRAKILAKALPTVKFLVPRHLVCLHCL